MSSKKMIGRSVMVAFIMVWGIWGCAGQPYDPPQTGEMPKGPGVFTKEKGAVTLYDSNEAKKPPPASEKTTDTLPPTVDHSFTVSDYEAFEAYQQWLRWKTSAVENGEWDEFQQWREWKKYKDWKNGK